MVEKEVIFRIGSDNSALNIGVESAIEELNKLGIKGSKIGDEFKKGSDVAKGSIQDMRDQLSALNKLPVTPEITNQIRGLNSELLKATGRATEFGYTLQRKVGLAQTIGEIAQLGASINAAFQIAPLLGFQKGTEAADVAQKALAFTIAGQSIAQGISAAATLAHTIATKAEEFAIGKDILAVEALTLAKEEALAGTVETTAATLEEVASLGEATTATEEAITAIGAKVVAQKASALAIEEEAIEHTKLQEIVNTAIETNHAEQIQYELANVTRDNTILTIEEMMAAETANTVATDEATVAIGENTIATAESAVATEGATAATGLYGFALNVVAGIARVTGLSMAASWAIATVGITAVIAGIIYLVSWLKSAGGASETTADKVKRLKEELDAQAEAGNVNNQTLKEYEQALVKAGQKTLELEEASTRAAEAIRLLKQNYQDMIDLGHVGFTTDQVVDKIKSGADKSVVSITELQRALTDLEKQAKNFSITNDFTKPNHFENSPDPKLELPNLSGITVEGLKKEQEERLKNIALIKKQIELLTGSKVDTPKFDVGSIADYEKHVSDLQDALKNISLTDDERIHISKELQIAQDLLNNAMIEYNRLLGIRSVEEAKAIDISAKLKTKFEELSNAALTQVDTDSDLRIKLLQERLKDGEINFEQYQQALDMLTEVHEETRLITEITFAKRYLETLDSRTQAYRDENEKILALEVLLQQKRIDYISKAEKAISTTLEKQSTDVASQADKTKNGWIDALDKISTAAIDAANTVLQAFVDSYQRQSEAQARRVTQAEKIAARGNAELLQKEQEKQDELLRKQRNFVKAQQALNLILAASNVVVAIAKAASQTGVAAPIAIAEVIAALAAGIAAGVAFFSAGSFYEGGLYEGGFTGHGDPKKKSRNRGNKPYQYEYEEFIFDHKKTRKYKDIFERVHSGELDLHEVLSKASRFDELSARPNISGMANMVIVHSQTDAARSEDIVGVRNELQLVRQAIEGKPSASLTINKHGIASLVQNIVTKEKLLRKFAS